MEYDLLHPWATLEPWQEKVIGAKGNVAVRAGRQVGKSTAIAIKAGNYALRNPHKQILIIAAVERQAFLLFDKVLNYIATTNKKMIAKPKPTKSTIKLINGSVIRCLPTGLTGYGIRGFTIDLLIADEAAFIPDDVWTAVTPMLAITKGKIILLSTPFGREGYFYRCFQDDNFEKFHVSSEECPRRDDKFLEQEKARMSKRQYAQEYLGEFVDELMQFFPTELIKRCMTLKRRDGVRQEREYFIGVDVARMGGDESTFEIIDRTNKEHIEHVESVVTKDTLLTESIKQILMLDEKYKFKKIYIDDGGLGVGVFDHLLDLDKTKRRVVAINNAARPLDKDKSRNKKILKEDLYTNLLRLMERGEIALLDDDEIFLSLKSVQFEYETEKAHVKMRIFGNYTHITEGLIRAAWSARDKGLNIWCR